MSLSALPDTLLHRIFSYLSLGELLGLHSVSLKWSQIQRRICSQIDTLTLQIGAHLFNPTQDCSFTIEHLEDLPEETKRFASFNIDYSRNCLHFDWLDISSVKLLLDFFPNITQLQIFHLYTPSFQVSGLKAWNGKVYALESLGLLLDVWAPQLINLQINCRFVQIIKFTDFPQIKRLFKRINSCTKLRHLTLKIDGFYFDSETDQLAPIDLPILKSLTEFRFYFPRIEKQIIENLVQYGIDNDNLKHIHLIDFEYDNYPMLEFLKPEKRRQLASKFVQFSQYTLRWQKLYGRFFWRNFTGVCYLHVYTFETESFIKMIHKMRRFKQLFAIKLETYNVNWTILRTWMMVMSTKRIQLPSIKILNVYLDPTSHDLLLEFPWAQVFPNLEILRFVKTNFCSLCHQDNEEVIVQERVEDNCIRLALKAWKECSKLRKVYTPIGGGDEELKDWNLREIWG